MPRVLYVEDNADNRMLVRRILMAADTTLDDPFDVQEAASAQKGIELARANPPDVILMDVSMPGMDGLTATQQLRAIPSLKQVTIIALTALAMEGDRERALNAGCDGYIPKPIDVDKLPGQILHYLSHNVRNRNERRA